MILKQKNIIDISKLRISLFETFRSKNKFNMDKTDDPLDFYFAIINALHSQFTVSLIIFNNYTLITKEC